MNAGAEQLTASGHSLAKIAALVGVSRETARRWRAGEKTPSAGHAATLEQALGIAVDAWRQRAGATPSAGPLSAPGPSDERAAALERVRAQLARLDAMRSEKLSAIARLQLERVEVSALRELRHLEGPGPLTEARIIASAPWRRIRDAIVDAVGTLPPEWQPAVALAVEQALEKLGGSA